MSSKRSPVVPESLQRSIVAALTDAKRRRHAFVTLEHLLLALLTDARAREVLQACGVNLESLKKELDAYLNKMEKMPAGEQHDPEQTVGFRRVLAEAMWRAQIAEEAQIESGDLLAALLDEKESQARYLLEQQGITRLDVLNYISHGITPQSAAPQHAGEGEEG